MKRLATMFLLLTAALLFVRSAHAAADPGLAKVRDLVRLAKSTITMPPEWDGVYTTVDSSYDCNGVFQDTGTEQDTLCGGRDYQTGSAESGISFDCTGSANATTIDVTCSGSSTFSDCTVNYSLVVHSTLSGSTSHTVSTLSISYSGTDPLCSLIPATCTQTDAWGTRTGPAPATYCTTPTRQPTWGGLKTRYR